MTTAERVLIRWLSALSAGVAAVSAALVGANQLVDETVILVVLVVSAFLSAVVAALTTQSGSEALGVRKGD